MLFYGAIFNWYCFDSVHKIFVISLIEYWFTKVQTKLKVRIIIRSKGRIILRRRMFCKYSSALFYLAFTSQWAFGKSLPARQFLGGSYYCCRWEWEYKIHFQRVPKCHMSNTFPKKIISPICQEEQALDCRTLPTIPPGLVASMFLIKCRNWCLSIVLTCLFCKRSANNVV